MKREELYACILQDAKANGRKSHKVKLFGDEVWKFQRLLRQLEYFHSQTGLMKIVVKPLYFLCKFCFHNLSVKLGFSIPINVFEPGLALPHRGTIVVASGARIGKNCRIHEGVTIGATNGSAKAANIGDNVFIASGAKIIGDVTIANGVAIGANAVVVKSILEPHTTWGGIPARKISEKGSRENLCDALFVND